MKKFSLPNMEHSFKVQTVGSETGINWAGDFKYRRPTLGARSRIEKSRAMLQGDISNVDQEVENFNYMISYLRHTLTEYPEWWLETGFGYELYDGNIVSEVFNKVMEYESEWKKKVHSGDSTDVEVGNTRPKKFEPTSQGATA